MFKLTLVNDKLERFSIKVRSSEELESVKRKLFQDGHSLVKEEKISEWFLSKRFSNEEMLLVTKVFQTISSSSIPVVKGLDIEIQETQDKKQRDFFVALKYQLESGRGLSESLKNSEYQFPSLYLGMVAAGEKSGRLGEIFSLLYGYLKKSSQVRRDLINASIYPLTVSFAAILVFAFVITYVIPQLSDLYGAFGKKLPLPTLVVIGLFETIKSFFWYILILGIALVAGFLFLLRSPKVVGRITGWMTKIPVLSFWTAEFFAYRFLKVLSIQLSGGESIVTSLETVKDLYSDNAYYQGYIEGIKKAVENGKSLSKAMASSMPIGRAIQYISLGEQAGKTATYLDEASLFYEERVNQRLLVLKEVIQPFLILVVGVLIGGILIALFLPILNSSGIINP